MTRGCGVLGAEPLGEGVAEYTARCRVKPGMTTGMQRGGGIPLWIDYRPFSRIRAGSWRIPLEAMEV